VIVFPEGEVQRENIDFVDHEESIETYGYDPDRHSSHANVQDCLEEKEELRYADIAPEKHTIVINQHVLVGFKMFRKYHESGTRHDTLIITHAAVVKRLRRRGIFTSVVDELVRLLQPRFVVIEAVLRAGGMPEWCLKNGFSDKYATGSFTKCVAVSEHPTGM
jgi:ribosomal protein S18 acetylase RimI-like enzyme